LLGPGGLVGVCWLSSLVYFAGVAHACTVDTAFDTGVTDPVTRPPMIKIA
jgi:hypothetical protein